jgi:endonuclease I
MKTYLLIPFFFLISVMSYAQSISFSVNPCVFDTTSESGIDSLQITLLNVYGEDVRVTDAHLFDIYGSKAFHVEDTSFIIPAYGQISKYIYFHPDQNIFYNSEVVFETDIAGSYSLDVRGQGRFSNSYYRGTENLAEESLKDSLRSIISRQYNQLSYNNARDLMYMLIDNQMLNGGGASQNTLECVYTGRVISGYQNRTQAQQSPYDFNTEHTYPQSLFNSALPMKSDLFHLFPTDITANSKRGSYPFGEVNSNISWQNGGSKLGNSMFEPRDVQKGPVARAMMYFVIRYQDYSNFFAGQSIILKQWNEIYPPDSTEINRNSDIYTYQNNRNPFIDYPQLARRINDFSSTSGSPGITEINAFPTLADWGSVWPNDDREFNISIVNSGNTGAVIDAIFPLDTFRIELLNPITSDTILHPGETFQFAFRLKNLFSPWYGLIHDTIRISFVNSWLSDLDIPVVGDFQIDGIHNFHASHYIIADENTLILKSHQPLDLKHAAVFNLQGQLLQQVDLLPDAEHFQIDISGLSRGLYLLHTINKNGYFRSLKFIKE